MLKQSITDFKINIGDKELAGGRLPLSVLGTLSSARVIDDVYYGTNAKSALDVLSGGCTLTARFNVDTVLLSNRKVMLSLGRVDLPYSVMINGTLVAESDGVTDGLFDVKDHLALGENKLDICFSGETASKRDRISGASIGRCELVGFNDDIITGIGVKEEMCDGFVRLTVSISTLEKSETARAVATIVSPGGRIYYCGISGGQGSIDITEPNLWWPQSYGVQNLYKLSANLYSDEEIVDSLDMRLGLADVTLSSWDEGGVPSVVINGVPIFTRGAVYIPDDMLLPYLDGARVKKNLTYLKETGANTVVIRDVGVFPGDDFFETCDALGLLVWTQVKSSDKAKEKLGKCLLGLSHHASFGVLVCENDDVLALAEEIIPNTPSVKVENIEGLFIKSLASVPDPATLLSVTPPEELNIFSDEIQYHTTLDDNISLLNSRDFRFPTGIDELHKVTAYSECVSLRNTVEWKRRERRSDLGVILERFNDPWPTVSESVVDYFGRRKPQHYLLRTLFAPVMISAVNEGTRVTFNVSNELKGEYSGKFSYSVITNKGELLFRDEYDITVAEREAMDVLTIDLKEIIGGRLDECFVSYSVSESFLTTSKGILLFTSPRKFKFVKPTFTTELSGSGTKFVLSIASSVPADKVTFKFKTVDAVFDENYIFIDDSSARRIEFSTSTPSAIELLRRELEITSLYDIGRNN